MAICVLPDGDIDAPDTPPNSSQSGKWWLYRFACTWFTNQLVNGDDPLACQPDGLDTASRVTIAASVHH